MEIKFRSPIPTTHKMPTFREQGNKHFLAGCHELAVAFYSRAIEGLDADERSDNASKCFSNRCACWIQTLILNRLQHFPDPLQKLWRMVKCQLQRQCQHDTRRKALLFAMMFAMSSAWLLLLA